MKKPIYYITIGFLAGLSFFLFSSSNGSLPRNQSYYPQTIFTLERAGYSLAYDGRTKGALWVYEFLTPENMNQEVATRELFQFQEDEEIPAILRSTNTDYARSGYDRGHLCPAMDVRCSDLAMKDSFYLSNASPQEPRLNRGLWRSLELQIRNHVLNGKTAHVYTLPLFLPQEQEGKRFVHYPVIGEHDVAVPTHFAKVVIFTDGESLAYILPNESNSPNQSLDSFKSTIQSVQKYAGTLFPSAIVRMQNQ